MTTIAFTTLDEMFMHLDDPTQPLNVHVEVRVRGRLDEGRLRTAIRAAAGKHQRARAHLMPWSSDAESYQWLIDDEPQVERLRVIEVGDESSLDEIRSDLYSQPLTLLESPPFRVLLVHHPAGNVVMLSIHHAASDGMGALRLLQSIVRAYAGVADQDVGIDVSQTHRLVSGASGQGGGDGVSVDLRQVVQSYPAPTKLATKAPSPRPGYGVHTRSLPLAPIVASTLRQRLNATVNDLLLAAVHRTVDAWNRENGEVVERISTSMPMNARPEAWRQDVVGNFITTEHVQTDDEQRRTPETCLAAVVGVTGAMRGKGPVRSPSLTVHRSPERVVDRRDMIKVVRDSAQLLGGTVTVSNLGRIGPDWVGGTELEVGELWFTPPPVGTSLGIGAASVGSTLHLGFRYSPSVLSTDAAAEFATMLNEELDLLSGS